jgi:hypothetical protein
MTPRQSGLVSEAYALEKVAPMLPNDLAAKIHTIYQGVIDGSYSGFGAEAALQGLADDDVTKALGYNPLDIEDPNGPVGTPAQEAQAGGSAGPLLSDVATQATNVGTSVTDNINRILGTALTAVELVLLVGAIVLGVYLWRKSGNP